MKSSDLLKLLPLLALSSPAHAVDGAGLGLSELVILLVMLSPFLIVGFAAVALSAAAVWLFRSLFGKEEVLHEQAPLQPGAAAPDAGTSPAAAQPVTFLLGLGIVLLPYLFVWRLSRPGYSRTARVLGFGWLIWSVLAMLRKLLH